MATYHKITAAMTEGRKAIDLSWDDAVTIALVLVALPPWMVAS